MNIHSASVNLMEFFYEYSYCLREIITEGMSNHSVCLNLTEGMNVQFVCGNFTETWMLILVWSFFLV